jgi:cytochrome c-type biogenesis protein CcmH/NrfG
VSAVRSEIVPETRRGFLAPLSALRALRSPGLRAFAVCAGVVAVLGFARGGYYATSWSWATIAALVIAAAVLLTSRELCLTRTDWLFLGGLAAFGLWIAVGASRAGAATRGIPQVERTTLYVAVVWAALQLVRRRSVDAALGGVLTGIVVVLGSGLATLLLPAVVRSDPFEGRLLFLPIGYANANGILAAIAVLLALGFVGQAAAMPRVLAAAALPLLVVSLDLTGSKGAAAAGAVGFGSALVLEPTRRAAARAALFLPLPLLGAAIASRSHVGDAQAATGLVARDGRVVAAAVIALTIAQAFVALRLHGLLDSRRLQRNALRGLAVAAALALVVVAFKSVGGTLGDRPAYWRAAWADVGDHALLGSGPGSFAGEWLRRRTTATSTVNAHNLYLETLAELGPVGLLLLLAALTAPLAVARRRSSPTSAAACGAYVAFLLHAGLDWDWQVPAVTVTGLVCGACVLVSSRRAGARPVHRRRAVDAAVVCSALLTLPVAAAGIGNQALSEAAHAEQTGSPAAAVRLASAAAAWQPWSAEPERLLGEIYLANGDTRRAKHSFARAVRLDPRDVAAWYGLARTGDPEAKARAVAQLLRLDPLVVRHSSGS